MSSRSNERDYYKQEFCATVLRVRNYAEISLRDAFFTCFYKAKDIRLKHGFSPVFESAWKQFRHYIRKNNLDSKENLQVPDM